VTEDQHKVCDAIRRWAEIKITRDYDAEQPATFAEAWSEVYHRGISKSCLLDRMLYHGEGVSRTPCPVHKGIWCGIEIGWPGTWWTNLKTRDRKPIEESPSLRAKYDAGCRCFQHRCGCTTGWQPDEHCGCRAPK
jgi:hypothetical protein